MALVERTTLVPEAAEYEEIARVFNSRSRFGGTKLELLSIDKVKNLVLQERFKMKKQQYEQDYGHVRIVQGWHGTKETNVASILKNNFDVSRRVRGRFGAGVSFSKLSSYAGDYSDKTPTAYMILSDVLVSNIKEVPENKEQLNPLTEPVYYLPGSSTLRYDTTARNKKKMSVFVKSEQDTFLPTHVVQFRRVPYNNVARPAAVSESSSNMPDTNASTISRASNNRVAAEPSEDRHRIDPPPPSSRAAPPASRTPTAPPALYARGNLIGELLKVFLFILLILENVFYLLLYAVQQLKVKTLAAKNLLDVERGGFGSNAALWYPPRVNIGVYNPRPCYPQPQ